jgi:hypothetical protein
VGPEAHGPVTPPASVSDDPAVAVGDGGVTGREREFTFAGTAGTFVYPDTVRPGWGNAASSALYGPDGNWISGWHSARAGCSGPTGRTPFVSLPETGTLTRAPR